MWKPRVRNESKSGGMPPAGRLHHRPTLIFLDEFELELFCNDPKDSELSKIKVKPSERTVEACWVSDVQIDPKNFVKGRKTHRTV